MQTKILWQLQLLVLRYCSNLILLVLGHATLHSQSAKMRPMFCVCLLVTTLSPETAEPVEMSLGVWTRVGQGTMYWVGARIPAGEGAILGASPGSLWSIGTFYHELCKNIWTNQHAVWDEASGGLKEPWIRRESKFPLHRKGHFWMVSVP